MVALAGMHVIVAGAGTGGTRANGRPNRSRHDPVAFVSAQRQRLVNIVGGSAGNLVEWFDWYVYSAFSLYFASSFFPAGNRTSELLSTALVFALGFVMRPIGAWIMGIYADQRGRKAGLTLSVSLMCLGSLAIAAAPTVPRKAISTVSDIAQTTSAWRHILLYQKSFHMPARLLRAGSSCGPVSSAASEWP